MTPPNNQINVNPRLVAANTKFGFNLFHTLSKQQPNQNIFISPTSVALALSMTYNGVSGETKQEMTKVLELTGITPKKSTQQIKVCKIVCRKLTPMSKY